MASAETQGAARLFVAVDPPPEVAAAIGRWASTAIAGPGIRLTRAGALHLTLAFLGDTDPARIDEVAAVVASVRPRPVTIELCSEVAGRPSRRPRVLALEVDSPALCELQAEVSGALVALGVFEPEERPFWPHLTLARIRGRGGVEPPGELPESLCGPFDGVRLALYRSELRPSGSSYLTLANLDLPPTAPGPAGKKVN